MMAYEVVDRLEVTCLHHCLYTAVGQKKPHKSEWMALHGIAITAHAVASKCRGKVSLRIDIGVRYYKMRVGYSCFQFNR